MERTARAWAEAKAKGMPFGRTPILTPHQRKEAGRRPVNGATLKEMAKRCTLLIQQYQG